MSDIIISSVFIGLLIGAYILVRILLARQDHAEVVKREKLEHRDNH